MPKRQRRFSSTLRPLRMPMTVTLRAIARHAAENRSVLARKPVAAHFKEIRKQRVDDPADAGPVHMPGQRYALRCGQCFLHGLPPS